MLPGVSKLPDATLKASITSWLNSSTVELPVFMIGPIPTSRLATAHASLGCLANSGLLEARGFAAARRQDGERLVLTVVERDFDRVRFAGRKRKPVVGKQRPQELDQRILVGARAEPDLAQGGQIGRNVRVLGSLLVDPAPVAGHRHFDVQGAQMRMVDTLLGTDDRVDPSLVGVADPGNIRREHLKAPGCLVSQYGPPTELGPAHLLLALQLVDIGHIVDRGSEDRSGVG